MLMLLLAATLAPSQNGCIDLLKGSPMDVKTLQKAGKGLWIGGIAFVPGDIVSAKPVMDPQTDAWTMQIVFTAEGNRKFIAAQRCGIGKPIEISFDRKVVSRPRLYERIVGGDVLISGGFTQESATSLARKIASAATP